MIRRAQQAVERCRSAMRMVHTRTRLAEMHRTFDFDARVPEDLRPLICERVGARLPALLAEDPDDNCGNVGRTGDVVRVGETDLRFEQ